VGISGISKAIEREKEIKSAYPNPKSMFYLWFIGVKPEHQGQGRGSRLLKRLTEEALKKNRSVFLETSTRRNLPWYKKHGFEIYHEHDFSYNLYFLKN
jgi:ribosomal protein S18 acetylase RimI-like enzyme